MKKRIAYIGLSYPLLYDYRNQAYLTQNDLTDSPNPIIESPLGLMILYDELWFLCESICPNNMRKLPYVKFVDKMFKDLYFEGAEALLNNSKFELYYNSGFDFDTIIKLMNISRDSYVLDNHSHGLKLGKTIVGGSSSIENFIFDIYIVAALQERVTESIEFISNSSFNLNEVATPNNQTDLVEKIIIPNIPNYLSTEGPYHECMEELRENKYITDFRKWIIDNHNNLRKSEINDVKECIKRTIKETQKGVFTNYLEGNGRFSVFKSSSKTIISTVAGLIWTPASILDATLGVKNDIKRGCDSKSVRWQGFVVQAKDIADCNNL